MSKIAHIRPANKEAFRQNAMTRLAGLDNRLERLYEVVNKVEAHVLKRIEEDLTNRAFTTYDWICAYNKLVDGATKLEKVRFELLEITMGSFDELADADESLKETDDQKKQRRVAEKMLTLLAKKAANG